MLEEQRIGGFSVVIELRLFPAFLDVAVITLGSENTLMCVVLLVTGFA
jgi:hypothetical protein